MVRNVLQHNKTLARPHGVLGWCRQCRVVQCTHAHAHIDLTFVCIHATAPSKLVSFSGTRSRMTGCKTGGQVRGNDGQQLVFSATNCSSRAWPEPYVFRYLRYTYGVLARNSPCIWSYTRFWPTLCSRNAQSTNADVQHAWYVPNVI